MSWNEQQQVVSWEPQRSQPTADSWREQGFSLTIRIRELPAVAGKVALPLAAALFCTRWQHNFALGGRIDCRQHQRVEPYHVRYGLER
jgi:hypothetical protein